MCWSTLGILPGRKSRTTKRRLSLTEATLPINASTGVISPILGGFCGLGFAGVFEAIFFSAAGAVDLPAKGSAGFAFFFFSGQAPNTPTDVNTIGNQHLERK